jgi:heme exporter protein D
MFQFASFADFIAMAGHGPYVWISYGVSLLVMIYLVISPLSRVRRQLRTLAQQAARQDARKQKGAEDV